jgi:membrane protein
MSAKQLWGMTKQAAGDWSEDNATRLAAALAFYTMLSIAPLLIICIKICGIVFKQEAITGQVHNYVASVAGAKAAQAAQDMVANAGQNGSGVLASIVSLLVLIFSASGVFGELQTSLNTIWEVKPKPDRGFMDIVKERLFSFAMVMVVAFLLLVSMVLSTAIAGVSTKIAGNVAWLWEVINFVISIVVITGLIALMFKYIPDVRLRWGDVIHGAIFTAVLFTIGKFLLGWYLGRATTTSVYGAAGSLVALLLWVYYSSLIVFFGAEFTQAYAKTTHPVVPEKNARPMTDHERLQQGFEPNKTPPAGVPVSCPSRPIQQIGWTTPGTALLAAVGVAAGAVLTGVGMRYTETGRARLRRRAALSNRVAKLETEIGDVEAFEHRARASRVSEHLHAIEHQLRRNVSLGELAMARRDSGVEDVAHESGSLARKIARTAAEFVKGAVKG